MKIVKNHAVQEGCLLLILCGALCWYSLDGYARAFNKNWSQSPYLFSIIIGGILGLLGLCMLLGSIWTRMKTAKAGDRQPDASKKAVSWAGAVRVLAILGISLVYYTMLAVIRLPYLAVTLVGVTLRFSTFELSSILFIAALMFYLGVRSKKQLILVPVCATVFLSVIFRSLLHVILP